MQRSASRFDCSGRALSPGASAPVSLRLARLEAGQEVLAELGGLPGGPLLFGQEVLAELGGF